MSQITLDDILSPEAMIPWKKGQLLWRCNVLAPIPKDIKTPGEGSSSGDDLWHKYTWIVWHYEKTICECDWMKAIRIMKSHRDSGEPAWMQLWREPKSHCLFVPRGIIKYG